MTRLKILSLMLIVSDDGWWLMMTDEWQLVVVNDDSDDDANICKLHSISDLTWIEGAGSQ